MKDPGFLGLGLGCALLLSLISWIIGLASVHVQAISCEICDLSSQPFEEMDPLNFIAGALDIWQAERRAEHCPSCIACICLPSLAFILWAEL